MFNLPPPRLTGAAVLLISLAATAAALTAPLFVPVYKADFPDPHIIQHEGEFLAYATNSAGTNLPMLSSRDLVSWSEVRDPAKPGKRLDAMPVLAPWVREGRTWAPEVMKIGSRWLLYYTANHRRRDVQCIGVATSDHPQGPFRDSANEPLLCQHELGGTIDANPFRDTDGQLYLYFKNDGNNPNVRKPTEIWGQRLTPDGASVIGTPVSLLRNDREWEAHSIEAPTMVRNETGYTMFFSAHHFGWEQDQRLSRYAVGYATCRTPLGPCTDAPQNPFLFSYNDKEAGCLSGPGHQAIFSAAGRTFISFHAWSATSGCRKAENKRFLYVAPLFWKEGKPVIGLSLRPSRK